MTLAVESEELAHRVQKESSGRKSLSRLKMPSRVSFFNANLSNVRIIAVCGSSLVRRDPTDNMSEARRFKGYICNNRNFCAIS